jgi:molecular chaperone DnaK (HSP70)
MKEKMKWIGIDFGTTNSVAAILDIHGNRIQETLGGKGDPVPTLVSYFQDDYRFGFEALKDSTSPDSPRLIVGDLMVIGVQTDNVVGTELENTVAQPLWRVG